AARGLVYPVYPGEYSASLGGNVGTNAGGMRAVKYGVTRHQVLGLEAVLAGGDVIRTGGRFVKGSTGYDLTQLIIGSEGTLALVSGHEDRLDADVVTVATQLTELGAIDVYVLPPGAATQLIEAREKAFWLAKAAGADDIVDVVVPRAAIAEFMTRVSEMAQDQG